MTIGAQGIVKPEAEIARLFSFSDLQSALRLVVDDFL